jgi:hypothetical protein
VFDLSDLLRQAPIAVSQLRRAAAVGWPHPTLRLPRRSRFVAMRAMFSGDWIELRGLRIEKRQAALYLPD